MEESLSKLDKTRFELATKNAELQEKVVLLQTDAADRKRKEHEMEMQKEEREEESNR
jgi:hypothetical protein